MLGSEFAAAKTITDFPAAICLPPIESKTDLTAIEDACKARNISEATAKIIYGIMVQDGWSLPSILGYLGSMVKEDDPYEFFCRGTDCTKY